MEEKQLSELIMQKIKEWKESQKGQTDGYEYERTFDVMMQNIGKDVLQESVGKIPENRKEKKTKNDIWRNRNNT
jgi:hypothetical protein